MLFFLEGDDWENFKFLVNIFSGEFNWKYKEFSKDYFEENREYLDKRLSEKERCLVGRLTINFIESYYVVYSTILELGKSEITEKDLLNEVVKNGKKQLIKGTLWRAESFSKTNYQVCVKSLISEGIVEKKRGKISNKILITERTLTILADRKRKLKEIIYKNVNE